MVTRACNPSTQEDHQEFQARLGYYWVPGQLGLQSKTLSPNKHKTSKKINIQKMPKVSDKQKDWVGRPAGQQSLLVTYSIFLNKSQFQLS